MGLDITRQRLHNQFITQAGLETAEQVVEWLGAVQAQDYGAAKWALGLRLPGVHDAEIEQAFTDGTILRTHVLRPTWHFVLPADIRWMQALTGERVKASMAYYTRQTGLDNAVFTRTNDLLAKALEGGRQLTRTELAAVLNEAGVATDDLQRLTHIMMRAELDCVICSGGRKGKQFTYALLDERAPDARKLERDEALAELTRRYFISHGPATLKDFAWWSGLTLTDAKAGLEMIKAPLGSEVVEGETYWFAASMTEAKKMAATVHLLPNYDEYMVAYTDRSAMFDTQHNDKLGSRPNILFYNPILLDTWVVGYWKHTFKKASVVVEPTLFTPLSVENLDTLGAAAQRYGEFLCVEAVLVTPNLL